MIVSCLLMSAEMFSSAEDCQTNDTSMEEPVWIVYFHVSAEVVVTVEYLLTDRTLKHVHEVSCATESRKHRESRAVAFIFSNFRLLPGVKKVQPHPNFPKN